MAKEAYSIKSLYKVSGDTVQRTNATCPKCGAGHFMAAHKDRKVCGKCGLVQKN